MTKVAADRLMPIEDKNSNRSGRINVGDGYKIYSVEWGNKNVKEPIFYL